MASYVFTNKDLFPVHFLGFVDPTDHYAYRGILTEDGTLRKYDSFDELIQHITQRRSALALEPIPNLDLVVQHYLYLVNEAPRSFFVRLDKTDRADIPRTVTSDAIVGAKIAFELSRQALSGKWTATGPTGFVTKTEAEQRAKTCANCPKNVLLKKSKFQRWNNKIAGLFTARRNTSYDEKLYDCGVCGCPLQIKVHFSDEVLRNTTPKKYKPENFPEGFIGLLDRERYECWLRKILAKGN